MEQRKKPDIKLYLAALALTIIIFSIGVYIGNSLSNTVTNQIIEQIYLLESDAANLQLLFLMEDSDDFCPVYISELGKLDKTTTEIGYKLSYLADTRGFVDQELKKDYFVLETESWLLARKIKEKCEPHSHILIYFYSNKNCNDCETQDEDAITAISKLNSMNYSTRFYSFESGIESPVVDALKTKYNVTRFPSLVIDEKLYRGPLSSDQIISVVKNETGT